MKQCHYCGVQISDNYIRCQACDNIVKWCDKLTTYWKDKNVEAIVSMFDEKCECYDDPFARAENIKELWQEIETQNIHQISSNILFTKKHECVVEFTICYEDEICNAINHIKFNEFNSKCIYLKQWYMNKEIKE